MDGRLTRKGGAVVTAHVTLHVEKVDIISVRRDAVLGHERTDRCGELFVVFEVEGADRVDVGEEAGLVGAAEKQACSSAIDTAQNDWGLPKEDASAALAAFRNAFLPSLPIDTLVKSMDSGHPGEASSGACTGKTAWKKVSLRGTADAALAELSAAARSQLEQA
eukprot:CAMPEP_0170135820 /NCGR_PEP_ID=MMETSP0033_2-20121228/2716_1 /TAXON_ID=195969 /ORGANISM="Dolichomastix tenuilepis, Strain CCMP3274" /LENGTH=163 /DNA_ID=CAMNT_0010371439 /DNA_START=57 /DNA_END=550 /DNA_ORIENTATION=+